MIVIHNPSRWVIVKISREPQSSKYIYNLVDVPPVGPPPTGPSGLYFNYAKNSGHVATLGF